jgi:hypothetical protein
MEQSAENSRRTMPEAMENCDRNPYLFIVGCPRSGTTLLKRMLDAHPQIAITRETHWITRYYRKRKGLTPEGMATSELIPKLFEYHRFPHLKVSRAELQSMLRTEPPISYADFVTGIFDLYGERKGKPLVGDKTPGYVRSIPLLHSLWPETRFVHLIRDGRDVCLSVSKWRLVNYTLGHFRSYHEDPVTTAALWWEWHVRSGQEGGMSLGPDLYQEVRYESLVAYPARECAALCGLLNVSYDAAMLRFHEGRTQTGPGLSSNRSWLPPTPGIRDWRSQMCNEDLERFEAVAGDLLKELGYERAFPHPSPQALEHAATIREAFAQDLRRRGQRSPWPQSAPR